MNSFQPMFAVLLICLSSTPGISADENMPDDAVDTPGVTEAEVTEVSTGTVGVVESPLPGATQYPWYDPQSGGLTLVPVGPERPLRRASGWEWETRQTDSRNLEENGHESDGAWRVVQYVVWIVLAVLLGALIYFWLATIVHQQIERQGDRSDAEKRVRQQSELIEQLPFQMKRPQADLLREAHRHFVDQDYREAMIYLFSYQLVQLDRYQLIRLAKGKTNRRYLYELRGRPILCPLMTQSMLTFEDVFFGHYRLSRDRFEACWNRLDEFEELVQGTTTES